MSFKKFGTGDGQVTGTENQQEEPRGRGGVPASSGFDEMDHVVANQQHRDEDEEQPTGE